MRCRGLAVLLLLAGCYRYTPAPGSVVAPGTYVRLALTPGADSRLTATLGAEATGLEGRVVTAMDSAMTVAVSATLKRHKVDAANRTIWAGEAVTVPRGAIAGIELRSLDRKRTTRAVALGAVGGVVVLRLMISAIGSIAGGTDDGGPVVIPP